MATQTIRQFIGTYHCLKYCYRIFLKAKKPECYQIYSTFKELYYFKFEAQFYMTCN